MHCAQQQQQQQQTIEQGQKWSWRPSKVAPVHAHSYDVVVGASMVFKHIQLHWPSGDALEHVAPGLANGQDPEEQK